MKKTILAPAVMGAALLLSASVAIAETDLNNPVQKESYAMGVMFAEQITQGLKASPNEVDRKVLLEALVDQFNGAETLMSVEDVRAFFAEKQQAQAEQLKQQMGENMKAGEAFLAEYAKKDGVKKTDSGIYYQVLTEGDGNKPSPTDTVKVHYRGTLKDGNEFDSSYARGVPAEFPVNGVIQGWQEVLQLMSVGSKWEAAIPSQLAYGERGAGGAIGPNEPLVFEIELLEIK